MTLASRRGWVTPCVVSPRGVLANHHSHTDPIWGELIGERVTLDTAEAFVVVAKHLDGLPMADTVRKDW